MEIKLNIIPQYRKDEIARSSKMRLILRWEIEITIILIIFFALLISLNYILKFNLDAQGSEFESKKNKDKYERIMILDDNFKAVNSLVVLDNSIQNDQMYWSRMFIELSAVMPDGVGVNKIANRNYRVLIAGIADTRDILVDMKERLSQNQCFSGVDLPLSNLVSKDNVAFQIEFDIKDECIKNK